MKKFLLSSAVAVFCSQNVQAGLIEFDLDKLGTLKTNLSKIPQDNPLRRELDDVIFKTERSIGDGLKCSVIDHTADETRRIGTYTHAEYQNARTSAEKFAELKKFHEKEKYTEEEKTAFKTKLEENLKVTQNEKVMALVRYRQEYPFRKFTSVLLGIKHDIALSLEEKTPVFNLLKESGVLRTSIKDLNTFIYNPAQEVVDFLRDHPETDTVVLGCGHFFPLGFDVHSLKLLSDSGSDGCRGCPHPTQHKGELTIDLTIGENPDVVADGSDLKIWKSIPQHRLARIIDESWGALFKREGLMELLKMSLKPGGEIIVQDYNDGKPDPKIIYKSPIEERALDIRTFKTTGVPNTIAKKADGSIQVTTDKSTYAYQLMSGAIPVAKSAPLRIPFEVNLEQGGFGVGLLSGDQSRFISQQQFSERGLAHGVLELPAGSSEVKVSLVFYNNSPQAGVSKFTVQSPGTFQKSQERALDIKTFKTSGVPNTIEKKADGSIQVTTDKRKWAYQLQSDPIPVDKSAPLRIPFQVDLEQGGFGVGILSGDRIRFISQLQFSEPGPAQGVLELAAGSSEETVILVFYNNSPVEGVSKFTIRK